MIALVIIFVAIFIIISIFLYFFSIAFVRRGGIDMEGYERAINKALIPYKDAIQEGIDYIDSLEFEDCYVTSFDGLKLYGRFFETENAVGTVILFHGYRSAAKRDFSCAIEMYRNFNMNILLVDQRSHGKSEGRLITFGAKERFDVLKWVEFINKKLSSDEPILLGGMSMGATTVLLSASLNLPQNVKGIIADSGFTSPIDIIKRVASKSYNVNSGAIIPIFNIFCKFFGNFSLYSASCKDALKDSKIPLLLFHGLKDNFVPCEMCQENYDSAVCDKEVHLIEGAGHGLGYFFDKQLIEESVSKFIDANIKK